MRKLQKMKKVLKSSKKSLISLDWWGRSLRYGQLFWMVHSAFRSILWILRKSETIVEIEIGNLSTSSTFFLKFVCLFNEGVTSFGQISWIKKFGNLKHL